jgi:hypothetical protein
MSIDIDHLKTWVGREPRASEVLSPFPARALAAMLDHVRLPEGGEPLPPAWHWLYFLETPSAAETDQEFLPSSADIEGARGVIAAFDAAARAGKGATSYLGQMIDLPVVARAHEVLRRADAHRQQPPSIVRHLPDEAT